MCRRERCSINFRDCLRILTEKVRAFQLASHEERDRAAVGRPKRISGALGAWERASVERGNRLHPQDADASLIYCHEGDALTIRG